MPGFELPPHMANMGLPGMGRGAMYPPYHMPTFPHVVPPPMYPRGAPPMQPPMDPKMAKMAGKPFIDSKLPPGIVKKDSEKKDKKEETGKTLELSVGNGVAEIFKSLQFSMKGVGEPLALATCKKILTEMEGKLKDKKVKATSKETSEFLTTLTEKIKELEKKEKKKSTSTETKLNELEMIKALHEV
jgi:hypothetical protein